SCGSCDITITSYLFLNYSNVLSMSKTTKHHLIFNVLTSAEICNIYYRPTVHKRDGLLNTPTSALS
ncbi:MAG: hypothetical protein ACJA0G_001164, partial [Kangiellaceae bacterium]